SLDITNVYYNRTIIEFDDLIQDRTKPLHAVSNQPGLNTFDKEKEEITGLNIFLNTSLSNTVWTIKGSTGFYDYYPQLSGFASNANATIKNNADASARIIRFAYGNGTQNNPYLIRDELDMKALSDITLNESLLNIYFKVMDGVTVLDLTDPSLGFISIGHSNTRPFRGGFDGNYARIVLNTNRATSDYVGLFGYLGDSAIIQNIEIAGQVTGRNYVGALSGYATNVKITNISNSANVKGGQYTAGLVGVITNVTMTGSYNMGDVTSTSRDVGGLVGWGEKSTLTNVFNFGNIQATQVVGGIIGYANRSEERRV